MKKRIAMLVSTLALVALAGIAQAATTRFAVQDATQVDKMVVQDNGYIGVGTTTPASPIYVVTTSNGNNADAGFTYQHTNLTTPNPVATEGPNFSLYRNNDPTVNGGLLRANDNLGALTFGSIVGGVKRNLASVTARAEGTWGATDNASQLLFLTTTPGQNNLTTKARFIANGNLGLGNAVPTQKIEVNGGVRLNTATAKPACDSTTGRGTLWFTNSAAGTKDTLEVCAKDATDVYAWRLLF